MQETQVRSLCWEDLLEKEMATHSRTLASKPPWTEEPVGLQSMGSQESDMTEWLHFTSIILTTFTMMKSYWQVEGLYLLFVVLWGWAETAETYLYLSYPFISPSPNTGQLEMLISISNFIFKAWDFGLCASDMLSDSIPSLTRNLKSIPSYSYFLRQSAFCPFNVYFSKKKKILSLQKKKSTLTYMFPKCVKIWTGMTKINLKILFPLGRREAGEWDQGGKRIHRKPWLIL